MSGVAHQLRKIMKNIIWLAILLPMLGCANMSEREKQTAWIVGGVVVAAIIISSSSSEDKKDNSCRGIRAADGLIIVC